VCICDVRFQHCVGQSALELTSVFLLYRCTYTTTGGSSRSRAAPAAAAAATADESMHVDTNDAAPADTVDNADADAAAAGDSESESDAVVDGAIAADTPADQLEYDGVLLPSHTVVELRVSF
jgi:hypothetical protein